MMLLLFLKRSKQWGHSDYKTTADRYVHPVDERKREAMKKIDNALSV